MRLHEVRLLAHDIGLGAGKIGLRFGQGRLRGDHGGFRGVQSSGCLFDRCFERSGIDFRHQLAFFYFGVEVGIQRDDIAGNLAAHLYGNHRVEIACGCDGGIDVAAVDTRGHVLGRVLGARVQPRHSSDHDRQSEAGEQPFLD